MLIAATATGIGFAFDAGSGSKELSMVFAGMYFVGCLAAVLAVRQSALFTAVVQPPLLLFVAVPTAYFLFHGGRLTGIRDTLINFGYPLIERFPLMFFTTAAALLIGMARWYYGMSTRRGAPQSTSKDAPGAGLMSAISAKVSALFSRKPDEDEDEMAPRHRRPAQRPARTTRPATAANRSGKPTRRAAPPRSRHARPPETEIIEPAADRPRRARNPRHVEPPAEPRRRARNSSAPRRSVPPPPERRARYERERPERRRRFDDYQPLEPHGTNGNGTHHPISRVRYRGASDEQDRVDYRPRRRTPGVREPEAWEYDIETTREQTESAPTRRANGAIAAARAETVRPGPGGSPEEARTPTSR